MKTLSLGAWALLVAATLSAAPITVNYERSITDSTPVGGDAGLPVLLCSCDNNVRFRYFVPDYASLISVNSITVSVDLYDEEPSDGNEQGELVFVLNGVSPSVPNVTLATFNLDIGQAGSPYNLTFSLPGADLANALAEIQGDGVFFFRVNMRRNTDFYVTNPQVTIDGELTAVPEPASMALIGACLAALVTVRRRR
ncbi:MAG: PEP-CTERM sorting domain-containing protein [Bryobacterales bacterium]|nr:PEP-CTERM sorting domain-containing protein [Bryobacterales bacterium]